MSIYELQAVRDNIESSFKYQSHDNLKVYPF